MDKIRDKINNRFKSFINKDNHPFFKDIVNVNKLSNNFIKYQSNFIIHKLEHKNKKIT